MKIYVINLVIEQLEWTEAVYNFTYLHKHLKKFFILEIEDALHPNGEGLLTELHGKLSSHLVRVEGILGCVFLVEKVYL